jgi:hypothetical protein
MLEGGPTVDRTVPAVCANPVHGDDLATWFYVEADRAEGVARRRCLACGTTAHLLDSESRWTYPAMWSCPNCSHSIAEVAFGLHTEDDAVTWVVMGLRCVDCGAVDGATDALVPGADVDEVLASL